MAFSPKLLISFIFLVTVLFSAQIQARESQFFSKVSATTNNENTVVTVPSNNERQQALNKQEQDPTFIPETQNNGYGLYGHESSENIHATTTPTTTTYTPYTTQSQETNSAYEGRQQQNLGETRTRLYGHESSENIHATTTPTTYTTQSQETNSAYVGRQQQNLGETRTRLRESGYTTVSNENSNDNQYYKNGRGGYNRVPTLGGGHSTNTLANQENINNNKYKYNNIGERQGMSDTRFLENGKYYYHVNNEQKYYPTQYEQNSRGVASSNQKYNRAGGYYGNNNEHTNSIEGFQNNQVEEEVFEENAEFEP